MKFRRSRVISTWLFFFSFLLIIGLSPVVAQMPQPEAIIQQARTLYDAGRWEEAVPLLQQAAAGFESQGASLNQGMALSNLAATLGQLTQWEQAEQNISSSLSLLRSQSPTPTQQRILAQTLDIQAHLQLERGRVQDAIDTGTQVIKLYQQLGAKDQLLQAQINQSQALQGLGLYPRACETLLAGLNLDASTCELSPEALSRLKNQSLSVQNVRAVNALGHILRVIGQSNQSQQVLLVGLQAAQQLGRPQEQAAVYLNLGNTARAFANQPAINSQQRQQFELSALKAYTQSAQLATHADTQLQAQINHLSLLAERANWTEAETLWRNLQPQVSQFAANRAGLYAQINLAQSLMKLATHSADTRLFTEIEQILSRADQKANRLGDGRTGAYVLLTQGRLSELQQQWTKATALTNQGLGIARTFEYPDIAYQLLWQLGRIQKLQGNTFEAIAPYTESVKILTALRGDLVTVNPEVQFSFRESVEPIYRELVGLLLQEESPSLAKLKQARQTIESLQLAEIDNFFRDACADAKPQLIDEVDPTAAVIYPIILSDRLEVILSIPGQPLRKYTTDKPQAELQTTLKQALIALRRTAFTQEQLSIVQKLYNWLIRPAEKDLTANSIKTLVFVLDGSLRSLPMATLHDGQQYLIQKYNIALTPGLQLLEPRPLTQVKLKALTAGLTEASQGFSALPGVASEIQQISAEISSNTLLNQQFIVPELKKQIKTSSFPILHLATHGQFSSNAAETFILTWDERVNVKGLDQLLRSRNEDKKSPIELLVLSACETASGDDRAALGLAGIAIRSGARSTVGSLWQVDDESTSLLISEFYRQLAKSTVSKAEALRNAQLVLLQNQNFQNPYFWAPFVLVGNWQ
ncbi:CHAT domain-containing protein [Cylindrospermum sp. FACHB-282]|uniref:CHAT domain-containing protein n=1 Tax=Cylindrospermum sp. FACHB-282 TaxID=2692794 RepID=UPI001687E906|nr:CHAT domain-containing protein [Cylindrospermum sp. FACHB-282]MBD2386227.1 CHAT domain-containing protein [Cylindrospermum sp. FACHB-282]